MYWEVGRYLNSVVLDYKRGEYGKAILATLSQELQKKYGNTFELSKLRRMLKVMGCEFRWFTRERRLKYSDNLV
ncbi:MAG: DUF1016 N-terminal domain-containing protein [Clostridiales Family XIII bacterium]|jgi:hypothetical protein|nr:DUF1016 N-terminal domain-containing protein [Clostridiales Family XIII bacterium]